MALTIVVALIIAAIVAVLVLDVLGIGWALRKLWRSAKAKRLRH